MGWYKVTDLKSGKVLIDSAEETRKAYLQKRRESQENEMSNIQAVTGREFSSTELELIKSTVAKGASNDELKLFLYRCKHLELDPLKPGQIHFIKYGSSPGTIVVGIEGFRSKAARTGKHSGTQRGILRDDKGKCVGAFCEVSRSDWSRPAREEVSLHEYNTGKSAWAKMPETMIKKVAEAAALRMAFPDDLGGIYINEEMDQAAPRNVEAVRVPVEGTIGDGKIEPLSQGTTLPPPPEPIENPGEYEVDFGKKFKGMMIRDICAKEWYDPETKDKIEGHLALAKFIDWCEGSANSKGLPLSFEATKLKVNFDAYMAVIPLPGEDEAPKFDSDEEIPW